MDRNTLLKHAQALEAMGRDLRHFLEEWFKDGAVPHPTTLMKLTTRCGGTAVNGLNEALLANAAEAKVLR